MSFSAHYIPDELMYVGTSPHDIFIRDEMVGYIKNDDKANLGVLIENYGDRFLFMGDQTGQLLIHLAAFWDRSEIMLHLYHRMQGRIPSDVDGYSLVHYIAEGNSYTTYENLRLFQIENVENPVKKMLWEGDRNGNTPLHIAAIYGSNDVIPFFLADNSPIDGRVLQIAAKKENTPLAMYLIYRENPEAIPTDKSLDLSTIAREIFNNAKRYQKYDQMAYIFHREYPTLFPDYFENYNGDMSEIVNFFESKLRPLHNPIIVRASSRDTPSRVKFGNDKEEEESPSTNLPKNTRWLSRPSLSPIKTSDPPF